MLNTLKTTLHRDLYLLFSPWRFWLFLAIAIFACSLMFFSYLEDFLAIQAALIAKSFRYGITDLVIIPYLKTMGYLAVIAIAGSCSRLFYWEMFADFSLGFRSTTLSIMGLLAAKILFIILLISILLLIIALPVLGSGWNYTDNPMRIYLMLFALFMLLLTTGILAMVLSQCFTHPVLVTLLTILPIGLTELGVRLLTEPTWLMPLIAFFSPLSHLDRTAIGVVTLSDGVFFIGLLSALIALSARLFRNTYLTVS